MRNDEVVKSVARVFETLELFERRRRPLTCAEIATDLHYPRSSTICLVKSMVTLGYLAFDCVDFRYMPTMRLPKLGSWIKHESIEWDVERLMHHLHQETGESVSLCTESDGQMKVLALSPSDDIASFSKVSAVGDCAPLFGSVVGLTSLSTRSDDDVIQVASNLLRRPRYIRPTIDIAESLNRIRRFRDSGFGMAYDISLPNVGALAWAVTTHHGKNPLVLGVWGPAARIKACEAQLIARVNGALLETKGAASFDRGSSPLEERH